MIETIPAQLFETAKRLGAKPAYFVKSGDNWRGTSWRDFADQIKAAGKALMALGVEPGGTVSILGFNRPEWVIMDVAAMAIGGAAAGVYTTCSPSEVQYIVGHAESKVILVENQHQLDKVKAERERLPKLEHIVAMAGADVGSDAISWEDFLRKGQGISDDEFMARLHALEPGGLATLIYTSGTTGPPKGVMLSHDNLKFTAEALVPLIGISEEDSVMSYLPLSHIAEQMLSIHGPVCSGMAVYYCQGLDQVADNLKEIQPTLMFGVPRIWEKFQAGVSIKLAGATGIKKNLVAWVRKVAAEKVAIESRGDRLGPVLAAQYFAANRLVLSKLKPALGLGRAKFCVSGAAPISKEVLEFFASLDILICEVYGQSEDSGPTTINLPGRARLGTVGGRIPGIDVKIAGDGEILVKGRNVFLGYYKDPEATAECLVDGWLHSGDLGELKDGFLTITGRKKEIIITAGGKNVAPKNIEASIKNCPLVSEVVVIGDRRKYLTALVSIDEDSVKSFLAAKGDTDGHPYHENAAVRAEIQLAVDETNKHLAQVETVKKFTVLSRNFTIEDGELTPTLKIKRNKVNEHFADQIEAMYEGA